MAIIELVVDSDTASACGWLTMLKYLRIALTALSLTACVLLIALWVRSPWNYEVARWQSPTPSKLVIGCIDGLVGFSNQTLILMNGAEWTFRVYPFDHDAPLTTNGLGIYYDRSPQNTSLLIPCWLVIIATVIIGSLPWAPWRFSLRTLLIGTTLIAVVMGIVTMSK